MADDWSPPRELKRSRPRDVALTRAGKLVVFLAALAFVSGWVFGINMRISDARLVARADSLRARGVTTDAEITRRWRSGGKSPHEYLEYRFATNGRDYQGTVSVGDSLYNRFQVRSLLPVRYLPDNPLLSHPRDWEEKPAGLALALLVAGFCFGASALCALLLRSQRRLLAEGVPVAAVVLKSRAVKGGWETRYTFRTAGGAIQAGRDKIRAAVDPGATVTVLFDPDRPGRNAVYPLQLYRVSEG